MANVSPIVHCVVDREPASYQMPDNDRLTRWFAANLSFECRVGAEAPDNEAEGKRQFGSFLGEVPRVSFHLFSVVEATAWPPKVAKHIEPVAKISGAISPGSPGDIQDWLQEQHDEALTKPDSYWTSQTQTPKDKEKEVVINADVADASHRMRAAHAWNAPVAHRFSLTHILRVPRDIHDPAKPYFIALPFFGDVEGTPDLPEVEWGGNVVDQAASLDQSGSPHTPDPKLSDDTVLECSYKPLGGFPKITCRTNVLRVDLADPLNSPALDLPLTTDGCFKVEKDFDEVRRFLAFLEERGASLMFANASLNARGKNPNDDPDFEKLFGVFEGEDGKYYWGAIIWYVVARLISALDNIVIALLKPIASTPNGAPWDPASEGEILGPLVTKVLAALEPQALDRRTVAGAIRSALASTSAVIAKPSPPDNIRVQIADTLRRLFDIRVQQPTVAPVQPAPTRQQDTPSPLEFVSAILERYSQGPSGSFEIPDRFTGYLKGLEKKSALAVARTLSDLEQPLLGEAGAEAALVKLFGLSIADDIAKKLIESGLPGGADLKAGVEKAWADYRILLDGNFSGAEAVRQAAGRSFLHTLLDHTKLGVQPGRRATLIKAIAESSFFGRRLLGPATPEQCFDPLIGPLVKPERDWLALAPAGTAATLDDKVKEVRKHLAAAFEGAIAPITSLEDPSARFIPDSAPQPLAIQVATTVDGSKADELCKHFNGVAVAIRRIDKGTDDDMWAHAHLANLRWDIPTDDPNFDHDTPAPDSRSVRNALHPMLPGTSDGRGAMFIEYQGLPFANPLNSKTVNGGEVLDPRRLFYRVDGHDYPPSPLVPVAPPVSRLAYGREFESFSFVTSNAGALPLALQAANAPWMPALPVKKATDQIQKTTYQRRTAITQMAVRERHAPRIGATIEGVLPLATDYPRTGLQAEKDTPGTRDIFRDSDGRGMMTATTNAEWQISDIAISGQPAGLTLRVFEGPPADPDATGLVPLETIRDFTNLAITIKVVFKPGSKRQLVVNYGKGEHAGDLPDGSVFDGWLRLVLEAGEHPATMTFAIAGSHKSDNVNTPLLLLAPKEGRWKKNIAPKTEAIVSTPRVTYLDFERWFANADLFGKAFLGSEAAGAEFTHALFVASLMRPLDDELAQMIDSLPDPAVEGVRCELIALDSLTQAPMTPVAAVEIELGDRLREFVDTIMVGEPTTGWTPRSLIGNVLKPLNDCFAFKIIVKADDPMRLEKDPGQHLTRELLEKDPKESVTASVPAGRTARLSLDALISTGHFQGAAGHPAVFHQGMKQYALRQVSGRYALPSAALRIETMYDNEQLFASPPDPAEKKPSYNETAIGLAERMIVVESAKKSRQYALMTCPEVQKRGGDDDDKLKEMALDWRAVGEIDVTTQRWRPSGRPIYHMANPRRLRFDGNASGSVADPAVRLKSIDDAQSKNDDLARFEREAFFDRSETDASTVTQRLEPLPARTRLQDFQWNAPSATYFRHRFTLRSRYAGALQSGREVVAWPEWIPTGEMAERSPHLWTIRVAMLAELSRLQLTRPQLRALIPLTSSPGDSDDKRPAPPVAAILQEPPFSRGGLADRVACEIKTGFGYRFVPDDTHVEIDDSRKEAGPSPFLSYKRLNTDTALALALRSEGPIGLTFDNVNAPAPAYPNSMLSLSAQSLREAASALSEEHFIAVQMRRYIDPSWTTSAYQRDKNLDGERSWWITLKGDPSPAQIKYAVEGGAEHVLVEVIKKARLVSVEASKRAIDGVEVGDPQPVQIVQIDERGLNEFAFLHQVVAPGRYSASIFLLTARANTQRGEMDAPLMLASFEWSPPEARKARIGTDDGSSKLPAVTLTGPFGQIVETMASAPTSLQWVKTSRDFDFIRGAKLVADEKGAQSWAPDRLSVRELVAPLVVTPAGRSSDQLTFARKGSLESVWLRASTFDNPQPLHVHRHLAFITSHFLKELGRPVELFDRLATSHENRVLLRRGAGGPAPVTQPEAADEVVRVVEFETPAQILCADSVSAPLKYQRAYFDLVSAGFAKLSLSVLRIFIRFVAPPSQLQQLTHLQVKFEIPGKKPADSAQQDIPRPEMLVSFDLGNKPASFAVGANVVLRKSDAGSKLTPTVDVLRSTGRLERVTPEDKPALLLPDPRLPLLGFWLSIPTTTPTSSGEFWSDVSLLCSINDDEDGTAFDFDWLFPPEDSNGDSEPSASVSATGLTGMVEAQARIIAVSPPIPMTGGRHG